MEKVVIACIGQYLGDIGIENVLVENEIFGPISVKSVMNGGNYIRGKRGMNLVGEAIFRLQLDQFFKNNEYIKYKTLFEEISTFQSLLSDETETAQLLEHWNKNQRFSIPIPGKF